MSPEPPAQPEPLAPPEPPMPPEPPSPPSGGFRFQATSNTVRGQQRGNFTWSHNGEKLEVEYRGEFEFTDDDTDVKSMTPGGLLRIRDGGFGASHSIEFRADESGKIERRYWAGSTERPFEPEGRKWLATALPRFVRQTGIGAAARVSRIYRAKGAQGVLGEIALIEGSWAKRVYFAELLKTPGLDSRTIQQALAQAGREVDSDFELASLLISVDRLPALDESARKAYFDAAQTIQSDFEMRRVLSSALKKGPHTPALIATLLNSSLAIESDFEQASLLMDVARLQPLDDATQGPFFKALGTVDSDFEHRRVLMEIMRRPDSPAASVATVLQSAANISSDFEVASVLVEVAKNRPIEGPIRAPFFRAIESIASGFERGRVLQTVAKRTDVSDETVLEVIKATQGMSGSFEPAQVLLSVAGRPLNRQARDAYLDAAEKLGEYEQGRVLAALVKNERRK
jgi:hypothetical protein